MRNANWNYGGGRWKLSRSKVELFTQCKRCFYLDNKLGIKRPSGPPFNLNKAVDTLLKQEFDLHRANGEAHPLQTQYGIRAVPARHALLSTWRENFEGVQYKDEETGLLVSGAIDDLWIGEDGRYIVVDYKATAKSEPVTALDSEWHGAYKRQMEFYQWLLRRSGLPVSDTGYFVYCTGRPDEKAFDGRLLFDVRVIAYEGDDGWVPGVLREIKGVLEGGDVPEEGEGCEFCGYFRERAEVG